MKAEKYRFLKMDTEQKSDATAWGWKETTQISTQIALIFVVIVKIF